MKLEIDEELWYGVSSDEQAEGQAAKSMAARMGRIVGAKPFPAAAQRLSQITQDPSCLMDEVVSVLESDPALSARLLRLVNSVGFSLRTACTSVRHAATLVGTEKLHQVASTAAILDMYESGSEETALLLEHATVVGALCRYLAFHFGLPPDELFTCGFLHDIGKLMLLDTEGEPYFEMLRKDSHEFDTLFVEERKHFGFDHAVLAGHVLAAWNIPHPVPKVVAWHHHVTRAYAESTEISQLVSTLRLADAMSYALGQSDREQQIQALAKTEAASYMDISEGQLAAMWDEVGALTARARRVFRGEKFEEPDTTHTSRPSAASLRAVAKAKFSERILTTSIAPAPILSERPRQFPCVVCDAPSYAHKCSACHGYTCPVHIGGEDEWCQLCQTAYQEKGIPQIRPIVSVLLGAALGGLLAAAFFGAASAGAQRPLKLMVGPTLILMLIGMLFGVGQHWVRRWWFLSTRPNRASLIPRSVEAVLDIAAKQSAEIKIVGLSSSPQAVVRRASGLSMSSRTVAAVEPQAETVLSLSDPHFPSASAVPILESTGQSEESLPPARPRSEVPARRGELRILSARERHWMSNAPRTSRPPAQVSPELSAPSSVPPPPERPWASAAALSEPPASAESLPLRAAAAAAPDAARSLPLEPFAPAFSARPITPAASVARSRRSGRPSSAAPSARPAAPASSARPAARPPSVRPAAPLAPARPAGRSPSVRPVAALPSARPAAEAPPVALTTELVPPSGSRSSLLPVPAPAAVAEVPESGWRELLDDHGTASGW